MSRLFFSLAFTALCVLILMNNNVSAYDSKCLPNELFSPQWGYNDDMILGSEPAPLPKDVDMCKFFAGKETCCNMTTLNNVNKAFKIANKVLEKSEDIINDNPYTKSLVAAVKAAVKATCSMTPGCSKELDNILEEYTDMFAEQAKRIQISDINCTAGLLAYFEGMICFACEPNWQYYMTKEYITISQNTCDSVFEACEPIYDEILSTVVLAVDFINDIMKNLPVKINLDLDKLVYNIPDMCGGTFGKPGNCKHKLCDEVLSAASIPNIGNYGGELEFDGITTEVQDSLLKLAAGMKKAYSPTLSFSHVSVASVDESKSRNKYQRNGGYSPYKVGCEDVLCPPAKSTSLAGWAIGLIVACVAVVIIGGTFLIFNRRRSLYDTIR